jgi:hypothetical protein
MPNIVTVRFLADHDGFKKGDVVPFAEQAARQLGDKIVEINPEEKPQKKSK